MKWNIVSDRPIYVQLVEQLKLAIVAGIYSPGDRLPSVRELAADAAVNANTMQRALAELEDSSLVVTKRTLGRSVTDDIAIIEAAKKSIAASVLDEFLGKIHSLGYSGEQTRALLDEAIAQRDSIPSHQSLPNIKTPDGTPSDEQTTLL